MFEITVFFNNNSVSKFLTCVTRGLIAIVEVGVADYILQKNYSCLASLNAWWQLIFPGIVKEITVFNKEPLLFLQQGVMLE